jgi:hypothetical protein
MTYNGWKNWETWNVALWCDNEESIYHERMRQQPRTAQEVEDFVREWFPEGTPDWKIEDDPYGAREAVDWSEIADHWSEDYKQDEEDETAA